jgi:hypothetical protein
VNKLTEQGYAMGNVIKINNVPVDFKHSGKYPQPIERENCGQKDVAGTSGLERHV